MNRIFSPESHQLDSCCLGDISFFTINMGMNHFFGIGISFGKAASIQSISTLGVLFSIISIYILLLMGWIPISNGLSVGLEGLGHAGVSGNTSHSLPIIQRRKALLIGINYFNTTDETYGCIGDLHRIKQFISSSYGFSNSSEFMLCLTDDNPSPKFRPTRINIINAMHWLVAGAQPGDSLFFYFAGHGSNVKDVGGDEEDRNGVTILPMDHKSAGQIIDDEMHAILVKPLLPGVRLTAIFDSCSSGTALDLPYIYDKNGNVKNHNIRKSVTRSVKKIGKSFMKEGLSGAVEAIKNTPTSFANPNKNQQKESPANVIMLSGCKEGQKSLGIRHNGTYYGVMSSAFIRSLSKNKQQTLLDLMLNIWRIAKPFGQVPQLSASRLMQLDNPFIM